MRRARLERAASQSRKYVDLANLSSFAFSMKSPLMCAFVDNQHVLARCFNFALDMPSPTLCAGRNLIARLIALQTECFDACESKDPRLHRLSQLPHTSRQALLLSRIESGKYPFPVSPTTKCVTCPTRGLHTCLYGAMLDFLEWGVAADSNKKYRK